MTRFEQRIGQYASRQFGAGGLLVLAYVPPAGDKRPRNPSAVVIYLATKTQFLHHALREDIVDVASHNFRSLTGHGAGASQMQAWKHPPLEMAKVLQDEEIPDAGLAIEYQLPQTAKRIDFVITGEDEQGRSNVVIVELKQWSETRRSEKDATIWAQWPQSRRSEMAASCPKSKRKPWNPGYRILARNAATPSFLKN